MLLSSEFKNCDFGDKRLTDRVINLANSISANPECSINAASGSFSASKAAYRFFQNEKVNPNAILGKHVENTLERAKACHSRVLVIQDTTDLIYTQFPSFRTLAKGLKLEKGTRMVSAAYSFTQVLS